MSTCLCFTIRFLQPFSHGRGDSNEPQWPPSPLRLFQALVASAAAYWNEKIQLKHALPALQWLETQPAPLIVGDKAVLADCSYRLYVPDNVADKVATSWSRGREASIADYRVEKDIRPVHLSGDTLYYLYPIPNKDSPYVKTLCTAARSITHLGWGIDTVVGTASIRSLKQTADLAKYRWQPDSSSGTPLRIPSSGTLSNLMKNHEAFLGRLSKKGFCPVPPLRTFRTSAYRRNDEPLARPYRLFELRQIDGGRFRYPHRRLIHLAGMVRHLAKEAMTYSPPPDVKADWVKTYIVGHAKKRESEHRQLSYIPLPSVGHRHTDPGIRRIMIVAPEGDDTLLDHVARRLTGKILKPLKGDEFGQNAPPLLVPTKGDKVSRCYTQAASTWHSFTPVILPGHDDHKPSKTRKLIEKALQQSGIDQPCEFEWGAFSTFTKSYSAHKYDRNGRLNGYIRPDHLLSQTATHLKLRFKEGLKVPGPITIGAGRHCGLGLFVAGKT